eukprot:COSAG03_NODE_14489_length_462_cov_1.264463_1_plen_67_part_01
MHAQAARASVAMGAAIVALQLWILPAMAAAAPGEAPPVGNTVVVGRARFTVITSSLLRLQVSPPPPP